MMMMIIIIIIVTYISISVANYSSGMHHKLDGKLRPNMINRVRFQVLTATNMKVAVFWDVVWQMLTDVGQHLPDYTV
jgi:hypothetical protein